MTLLLQPYLLSREGRYREAYANIGEGLGASEKARNPGMSATLHVLAALLHEECGEYAPALEAERLARANVLGVPSAVMQRIVGAIVLPSFEGILDTRGGRLDRARQRLDEIRKVFNSQSQTENWSARALEGEIALAAGDPGAAEAAFGAAEPRIKMDFAMGQFQFGPTLFMNNWPSRDGLARVKKARGDLRGAIEAYRVLLTPDISSKWTAILQPRYVLERARLLERAGDTAAANAEYQHFLDLWKHADPGLPELAEARRKVSSHLP